MLVGCYTPDKGTASGIAVVTPGRGVTAVIPAVSPSFVVRHPSLPVIYAVVEEPTGGVAAWSLDEPGRAKLLGTGETGGADPCHLAVHPSGHYLVTVNYTGGSVCAHRLRPDGGIGERTALVQHTAHGVHERQDGPHAHMVRLDGDRALVSDLGADAIYEYALTGGELQPVRVFPMPAGSGPRHFRPTASGTWLVGGELSGEIMVFEPGFAPRGRVPATASGTATLVSELATGASERFLYVGNRGPDTIAVFALEPLARGGLPDYVTEVPTGHWPRHILVDGDLLHVANQLSDEVTTMRIDPATGVPQLADRVSVPSPTCILR